MQWEITMGKHGTWFCLAICRTVSMCYLFVCGIPFCSQLGCYFAKYSRIVGFFSLAEQSLCYSHSSRHSMVYEAVEIVNIFTVNYGRIPFSKKASQLASKKDISEYLSVDLLRKFSRNAFLVVFSKYYNLTFWNTVLRCHIISYEIVFRNNSLSWVTETMVLIQSIEMQCILCVKYSNGIPIETKNHSVNRWNYHYY